jgi:hypothetical protein
MRDADAPRGEALDLLVIELRAMREPGAAAQPPGTVEVVDGIDAVQPAAQLALGRARVVMRMQAAAVLRGHVGERAHERRLVVRDVRRPEVEAQERAGRGIVPAAQVGAALREPGLFFVDKRIDQ